jgi:predicted oxidoreductase
MELKLSRFIWGQWRLLDWGLSYIQREKLTREVLDMGISSIDHADIYGDYSCEAAFGEVLKNNPSWRSEMQLISKCGIKLISDHYPNRKVKYYDYSYDYIVGQAENSLRNLNTDILDLLLLHRPSPFFNAEEVASAFDYLYQSGKVKSFGVSNFLPHQIEQLAKASDHELVTNQIELSIYSLEHFENQNINFLQSKGITPMAWSPLAGGKIFSPDDEKSMRVQKGLYKIQEKYPDFSIDQIALAWLLMHPSGIQPILGSGNLKHIKNAIAAQEIKLSLEDWFYLYTCSTGHEVP